MSIDQKSKYDLSYKNALNMLNAEQRKAVEKTEDPVMVLAGPGTGKTQLLGVRVGYILKERQVSAHNILCLTFTDAGAVAMRRRLLSFIGPEAYNAHIYTYHSFCNTVIQDNIEYFGGYRDLQLVSDIEQVEIIHEILEEVNEESILKKFKGNLYHDRNNLISLFSTMKRENWDYGIVAEYVDKYEAELRDSEEMTYKVSRKGKYNAGDFKQAAFEREMKKYWRTKDAASLLDIYNRKLQERQRYDYQDMILFVIRAFQGNEDLKLDYQERYQYILVDEYQDTNGSQNDLIFLLADYWEEPNLFVVGDDDQAIFRFQGANMNSLSDFINKFNPSRYRLRDNYRSDQRILDAAHQLIQHNHNRIAYIDKENNAEDNYQLKESRSEKGSGSQPEVYKYQNPKQEQAALAQRIKELHANGVKYSEMAVIYRSHATASDLVKYLTIKDIPLQIKKKVNVLDLPEIKKIHTLLQYLSGELEKQDSQELRLFQIMHFDYFGLAARDIGYIAAHCSNYTDISEDDRKWRKVIASRDVLEKIVDHPDDIVSFSQKIEGWIRDIANITLQTLFEKVITESGILGNILASENKTWQLQVLNKYFDLIKNESAKSPNYSLRDFLQTIDTMQVSDIPLPLTKVIHQEDGINFLTAHGSKGLEFEYVFIINATQKEWEQKIGSRGFRFPPGLVPISETSDIEDDRRLFYVALTRAKNHVYISHSIYNEDGKDMQATRFISELGENISVKDGIIDTEVVEGYISDLMKYVKGQPRLIDRDLIDQLLTSFSMSATALNKFINCRLSFYFDNLLRVPRARSSTMGYGSAIHYALELYFKEMEKDPERSIPDPEKLIFFFKKGMGFYRSHFTQLEYQNLLTLGTRVLKAYYNEYHHQWQAPKRMINEKNIKNTEVDGIPIKGKLDRIDIYDQYVNVVDYKTGTYKKEKLVGISEDQPGGDYWRQLVFYKLLIDNDPTIDWKMNEGIMDFVEKSEAKTTYDRIPMQVSDDDVYQVTSQLKESWRAIHNYEFEQFCDEEKCHWCDFVRANFEIEPSKP